MADLLTSLPITEAARRSFVNTTSASPARGETSTRWLTRPSLDPGSALHFDLDTLKLHHDPQRPPADPRQLAGAARQTAARRILTCTRLASRRFRALTRRAGNETNRAASVPIACEATGITVK